MPKHKRRRRLRRKDAAAQREEDERRNALETLRETNRIFNALRKSGDRRG